MHLRAEQFLKTNSKTRLHVVTRAFQSIKRLRVRFFKKIHDQILKSKRILKRILHSLLNRSIQDLSDHGASKERTNPAWKWIRKETKCKIRFCILSDIRIQSWIFLKKCTLSIRCNSTWLKLPTTHHHFQIVDSQREAEKYERNHSRGTVIYVLKSFVCFNFLTKTSQQHKTENMGKVSRLVNRTLQ